MILVSQAQQHSTCSLFLSNQTTAFGTLVTLVIAKSLLSLSLRGWRSQPKQSHRVNENATPPLVGAGGQSNDKPGRQPRSRRKYNALLPRTTGAFFRCWGTFYLNLKGLIKINNTATLETLPLEEGLQFFVTFRNEGTNRANIFDLAMIQDRLN